MPGSAPRLCRVAGRDTWHIYHQRRRVSTGCTSRAEAELVLAEYAKSLTHAQMPVISVGSILAHYLADRHDRKIPGVTRLEYAHKPLTRILGHKPPETITEAETRSYLARRAKEDVAPATSRTELQALRAALRWAEKSSIIVKAPSITMPPRSPSRIRWLSRAEADRLLLACKAPHIRLFVMIALNTGARSGAILSLAWDRVDLDGRTIDFRIPGAAQTRKRRVRAPINDTLHSALAQAKALTTTEHVIEWAGGSVERIKHGFRDAAIRADLKNVTPHVLRHTAVTWALQDGQDPWAVAGFVGMSIEMVQEVYGHHHPEHLRSVARALG